MPQLAIHEDCTGCMACYNSCSHEAIEITKDDEGFSQPVVIEDKCVKCNLCEMSCPIVNPLEEKEFQPHAYAAWHEEDRSVSSSGGAFSAFARKVLAEGGIVVGAAFDKALHLRHTAVNRIEGLESLRGSKYVQSEIEDTFRTIRKYLQDGRKVLFCGTPCQVAGLHGFLRKDYDKLLTADLVCHGVPSDKVFQNYLKKLKNRLCTAKDELYIEKYEFRHRDGWGISPSISTSNNCQLLYGVDALYMEAFDKNALFRKSCYHCPFAKIPRVGDVTLADFWGLGRHGKKFKHSVTKGVSLILVNTEKGNSALKNLDNTFIEERNIEEALIENHNLIGASKRHAKREDIIKAFLDERKNLDDIDRQYHLVDHSVKGMIKMWLQKLGLFKPIKALYNWYKSL
ncbi:MAG: Coenzyme F420 hydrogenase/dehydrogenase, beta subunit C-terminal domain [Bacteroidaceae bacterium]|nr:Coenzyme F420 hydrogenase/dehydrogenase, beta subunit C-terminal domain [Bacteroidaceae bacterium]